MTVKCFEASENEQDPAWGRLLATAVSDDKGGVSFENLPDGHVWLVTQRNGVRAIGRYATKPADTWRQRRKEHARDRRYVYDYNWWVYMLRSLDMAGMHAQKKLIYN